eukprot:TRINITY_DN17029_c0_g1_i1.p1 TRINITY_DN17029_c0_g1~~TRINITY_DN17029_c0_g1_i1.p1  ORF type:complete len:127 (-),score=7.38 TRINITY_DN17029_c0_g1_i1:171-551(-)
MLSIALLLLAVCQTQAFFFGGRGLLRSQCTSDSGCPTFRRSRCLGDFISCIFGNSESYIVSGRCLNRSNLFCDVGNLAGGGRRPRNCRYGECAQCLQDSDCTGFNQYCLFSTCRTRNTNFNTNTGK